MGTINAICLVRGVNSTCSSFFLSLAVGVAGATPRDEGRRSLQARRGDGTDAGGPAASPEPGARGHGGGRGGAHGGQRVAAARELARPQLAASPGAATTVATGWRMQWQATQERLGPSAEQRTAGGQRVETQKDGEMTFFCVPRRLSLKMRHSFPYSVGARLMRIKHCEQPIFEYGSRDAYSVGVSLKH